jgi:hypothetical protein
MITRQAPAWAWDIIDETLAADARSRAFDAATRNEIGAALDAMQGAEITTVREYIARLKTLPPDQLIEAVSCLELTIV